MKGKERRDERELFCINIMYRKDKELLYTLVTMGNTIAYPIFRKPIRKLL
jgi:hypothetical protein